MKRKHFIGIGFTVGSVCICRAVWNDNQIIVCNFVTSQSGSFGKTVGILTDIAKKWDCSDSHTVLVYSSVGLLQKHLEDWQKLMKRDYKISLQFELRTPTLSPKEAPVLLFSALKDGNLGALPSVDLDQVKQAFHEIEADAAGSLSGTAEAQSIAFGPGEALKLKLQERKPNYSIDTEFVEPTTNCYNWFDPCPINERLSW